MKHALWLAVTCVVALVMMVAGVTGALWHHKTDLQTGSIESGNLELLAGDQPESYLFTALNGENLAPGGVVSAPLIITNSGSTDLVYKLESVSTGSADTTTSSAADGELASALTLLVTDDATCDGTVAESGVSTLYQGLLSTATYTGSQLASSSSVNLCITVGLPEAAPATASAGAVSATFIFRGDQVL